MPSQEETNPFYEDKQLGIRFVQNPNDGPDGYDIFLGKDHFYLQSRCLPTLAHPNSSTSDVQRSLEAINPSIPFLLQEHDLTYAQMHIAFLKVKLLEEEALIDAMFKRVREYAHSR